MLQTFSGWIGPRLFRFTVIDTKPPGSRDLCEAAAEMAFRGHSVRFEMKTPLGWSQFLPIVWTHDGNPNQAIYLSNIQNALTAHREATDRELSKADRVRRDKLAVEIRRRTREQKNAERREKMRADPELRAKQAEWSRKHRESRKRKAA